MIKKKLGQTYLNLWLIFLILKLKEIKPGFFNKKSLNMKLNFILGREDIKTESHLIKGNDAKMTAYYHQNHVQY
jgi:hypothetical protein